LKRRLDFQGSSWKSLKGQNLYEGNEMQWEAGSMHRFGKEKQKRTILKSQRPQPIRDTREKGPENCGKKLKEGV